MKRSLLGLVVAVSLVLGTGAVALAANIDCTVDTPCIGTRNGDTMNGTPGQDEMRGRAGDDAMQGTGGSDEMWGGLGADKVLGGTGGDLVWGGEQKGSDEPFTYPEKSSDNTSGGPGPDTVYGGFGQGGVDAVFGNGANDTVIVAQRGFPESDGEVKVTKEVVDCGTGEDDTVYRDKGLDVIANNCEHKRNGFPDMDIAAAGTSAEGGLFEATSAER
jgi:Ca2+-binding RTX toxin-like protein